MKLWPRAIPSITSLRKLFILLEVTAGCLWFVGRTGYLDFSEDTVIGLQAIWILLLGVRTVRDFSRRKSDPPLEDPGPAIPLTIMILLTGMAGVFAARKGGPEASTSVPYIIAVGTILLAILAFTLASKYKDQIGEARFKSPTDKL